MACTSILDVPQRKKARGVRSGKWDCQVTGVTLQIHLFRNFWIKSLYFLVQRWRNSSCRNSMLLGPSSSRIGMRNPFNISSYTMPVAVYSAKTRDNFCLDSAQNTFDFELSPFYVHLLHEDWCSCRSSSNVDWHFLINGKCFHQWIQIWKFIISKSLKRVAAKYVVNLFLLGSYMLQ